MRECLQEQWMWVREAAGLPLSAPMSCHCREALCLSRGLGDKVVTSWWVCLVLLCSFVWKALSAAERVLGCFLLKE